MLTTFNCGLGMIVCVAEEEEANTLQYLDELGEKAFSIGTIISETETSKVYYV
jgi:phosphoribosylformylglycinamidine cyclo-ligase